jgi:Spy/CpxP family protein refolding chaperone
LCLALLLGLSGAAQNGPIQPQQQYPLSAGARGSGRFGDVMDDRDPAAQEKQLRALNADRQKSLVADTNKLLKLAAELNEEVSSAQSDSLTLEQLHNLAEIEKLAHSVKEKMSTSVRPTPVFAQPFPPNIR